jgi:CHAT domain-containing protein
MAEFHRLPVGDRFAAVNLGPELLRIPYLLGEDILVPISYFGADFARSTVGWEQLAFGAWESLEEVREHGLGVVLGTQIVLAVGGNRGLAEADPDRYEWLALVALECFKGKGMPWHEGRTFLELGNALRVAGRRNDAITAYQRGWELLEAAADRHGMRAAQYYLALTVHQATLPEQALVHLDAADAVGGEPAHPYIAGGLFSLRATCLSDIGYVDEAADALARWRSAGVDHGHLVDFHRAMGDLRWRQGRMPEARDEYCLAVEQVSGESLGTLISRADTQERRRGLYGNAVATALETGRADLALGVMIASATSRPVHLRGRVSATTDPAGLARYEEQFAELARRATIAVVAHNGPEQSDCEDRARWLLAGRDLAAYDAGEDHGPGPRDGERVSPAAIVARVRAGLGPGDLVLAPISLSDGRVVVLAGTAGEIVRRPVALSSDEAYALLRQAIGECERRTAPDALHRLGAGLIEPVADLIAGASRVTFAPYGSLADFPYHAAPYRGLPLAASVEVRLLPSPGLLPLAADRTGHIAWPGARARAAVVGIDQPRYEVTDPLPGLDAEAAAVRQAFPAARELRGDAATAAAVRTAMTSCDVLHIAGHAAFDVRRPNLARILLVDRPLFAFEVAAVTGAPSLVNLSGCRAASGRRLRGGESEGLAAAFLDSGARTVVAPQWNVRDDAALAFNEVLYGELARPGAAAGDAVRRAQLALLRRQEYDHPGLWGAFSLLGSA